MSKLTECVFWTDDVESDDRADKGVGLAPALDDLDTALGLIESAILDPDRADERQRVLEFCQEHSDALHRTCLSGHLTGSAFVVDRAGESVLLIHHRKLERWLQPGGHADGQGNLALVALAEVREETGLEEVTLLLPAFDIDVHVIPARPGEPEHLHLDLRFVVVADRDQHLVPAEGEVFDARWFAESGSELAVGGGVDEEVSAVASRAMQIVRAKPWPGHGDTPRTKTTSGPNA